MRTQQAVPLVRAPRRGGRREKADPGTMVIFGGAGDLTKRKLIPAIYYLAEQKLLPDNFALLGVARDQNTDDGYRAMMREAMSKSDEIHKVNDDVWQWLCQRTFYAGGDFTKDVAYANIEARLKTSFQVMLRVPSRLQCSVARIWARTASVTPLRSESTGVGICWSFMGRLLRRCESSGFGVAAVQRTP